MNSIVLEGLNGEVLYVNPLQIVFVARVSDCLYVALAGQPGRFQVVQGYRGFYELIELFNIAEG